MNRSKKRIPYQPDRDLKGGKSRFGQSADRVWLDRRMLVVKTALGAGFLALGGRLAQLQILRRESYEQQARNNILQPQYLKSPRGIIFDRQQRPVAENRRTWEIRVTPASLPEDPVEFQRVRETLINALSLPDALIVNPNAVPFGSEEQVYARIGVLLGAATQQDVQDWIDFLTLEASRNYVVLCDSRLSADEAARFRAASRELPGVEVVNYFDYLLRNAGEPRLPITVRSNLSREIALKLEANRIYLPGVEIDDSAMMRVYPGGPVMAHILGYVGIISPDELQAPENRTASGSPVYSGDDIIGKSGLELTQENLLRGDKGFRVVEVDTNGVFQRVVGIDRPVSPGRNLALSIDLEVQAAVSAAIEEVAQFSNLDRAAKDTVAGKPKKAYDCGSGAVVMLDPRNGEVLALVSYPTFDNALFIQGLSQRKYDELLDIKAKKPLINRCVADNYPPGSTLKLFVAAAALREGVIDGSSTFTCTGAIKVPYTWDESKGNFYPCWLRDGGHGTVDVVGALERSCDIFFYNLGAPQQKPEGAAEDIHYYDANIITGDLGNKHYFRGLGIDRIHDNLTKRFWYGRATEIDLPWEAPGLVPNPEWLFDNYQQYWSSGDTINASIGQGYFLATPLQVAVNTAAIANGGIVYKPLLIRGQVDDAGALVEEVPPQMLREIKIDKSFLLLIRESMWNVVNLETGTANRTYYRSSGLYVSKWLLTNPTDEEVIPIAGKTGTAEFGAVSEDGTYAQQHAWFTAFAPYDIPEVVVTVFLENGGEGSSYAVPIADRALRAYFEATGKRPRGLVLRDDGLPIDAEHPAPVSDATKLVPGQTVSTAQD